MRIVIIGAGGIGGWLGARLAACGQQVGFLVHDRTLAALRSGGLTLRDCSGGEPGTVAARIETPLASDAPEELTGALGGDPDLVFVTTKVDALPQLAPTLRRLSVGASCGSASTFVVTKTRSGSPPRAPVSSSGASLASGVSMRAATVPGSPPEQSRSVSPPERRAARVRS